MRTAVASTTTNSTQRLAYSRVTRPPTQEAESLPVLMKEVEEVVRGLKAGKSLRFPLSCFRMEARRQQQS